MNIPSVIVFACSKGAARLLLFLGILIFSLSSQAHGLRVAALPIGQELAGNFHYSDGRAAINIEVGLYAPGERKLREMVSDNKGRFRFTEVPPGEYRVVGVDLSGHRAHATVRISAPIQQPKPGSEMVGEQSRHSEASSASGMKLTVLLRSELQPLREEIARLDQRTRFRDIVAGICVILGIFGALSLGYRFSKG